jgi:hypothetical protein
MCPEGLSELAESPERGRKGLTMAVDRQRLERAEQSFRTSADEVNQLLQVAEQRAASLSPGYVVYSTFDGGIDEDRGLDLLDAVAVAKIKGQWRLAMACGLVGMDQEVRWTPILECSIDERIRAASNLEPLFEKLVQVRIEQTEGAKEAATKLRKVLRSLGDEPAEVEPF